MAKNGEDTNMVELRKDPTSGRWTIVHKRVDDDEQLSRYKAPVEHLLRERINFEQTFCVFSRQFASGKRQEKEALFGLRWSGNQVEITYGNWHADDREVMVVKSDYAQVVPEQDHVLLGEYPFIAEAGFGIHELIIEDPQEEHLPLGVVGGVANYNFFATLKSHVDNAFQDFIEATKRDLDGKATGYAER